MGLSKSTAMEIINYCNKNIVPDQKFIENSHGKHPITWFQKYFSFINDLKLRNQLADAYYQARFIYKLMVALNLTSFKKKAVIKFQIIQYASIYEAVIDHILDTYHRGSNELQKISLTEELKQVTAFSKNTTLTFTENSKDLKIYPCKSIARNQKLKEVRFSKKLEASVTLNIVDQMIADRILWFYELRNNVHLTTAAINKFYPNVSQSIEAFETLDKFIKKARNHIKSISTTSEPIK
jgi:hypothetical protein